MKPRCEWRARPWPGRDSLQKTHPEFHRAQCCVRDSWSAEAIQFLQMTGWRAAKPIRELVVNVFCPIPSHFWYHRRHGCARFPELRDVQFREKKWEVTSPRQILRLLMTSNWVRSIRNKFKMVQVFTKRTIWAEAVWH